MRRTQCYVRLLLAGAFIDGHIVTRSDVGACFFELRHQLGGKVAAIAGTFALGLT